MGDDDNRTELTKGMVGKIVKVDKEGDALVKFWEEPYEEDAIRAWVYRTTAWEKLEFIDYLVRHRAAKVAKCLDQCTIDIHCSLQDMNKRTRKVYGSCIEKCNMDACNKIPECKDRFQKYGLCKNKVARDGRCTALPPRTAEL